MAWFSALIMIVVNVVLYVTGAIFKPELKFFSLVSYIPFLVGIIMNGVAFSKSRNGFVTFGNVFVSCFKATLIVALVMVVWATISAFVFPEMKDRLIDMQRDGMVKKGMTDDQIDMAVNMTKKYWTIFMYIGTIFGTLLFGAIFSLIGGAVAKKKGEMPFMPPNAG